MTVYALSAKNVRNRTNEENENLLKLLEKSLELICQDDWILKNVKIIFEGHTYFNTSIFHKINYVTAITEKNENYNLRILLKYDGRNAILSAVSEYHDDNDENFCCFISEKEFHEYVTSFPDIDYVIRTGAENRFRLSGFCLWECSYAELKFRNELFPEYNVRMLMEDLEEFNKRVRNFGK